VRYSTIENWARYFQETEGVRISDVTIRNKLREAGIIGITGKNKVGRVLRNAFYSETDVRSTCADLLQSLPKADEYGFFEKDDRRYGTIKAWSKSLGISTTTITRRIKTQNPKSVKGKNNNGNVYAFFSEADIRGLCADLLEDIPQADENGFFEKDGQRYGTIISLSSTLGISAHAITKRIKIHNLQSIKGKMKGGQIYDFFPESSIREICEDLLQSLPEAEESGFFTQDGQRYGTIISLSSTLGISAHAITKRIKIHNLQSIKGKTKGGQINDFYSESEMRKICSDILQSLPEADESGFLITNGQRYGTIGAWPRALSISVPTITDRIKTHNPPSIKCKDKGGRVCDFYPESVIRKICADLLQDIPQTDENGFFMKDGLRYGTIGAWSKTLGISVTAIKPRIKAHTPQSIKGKDRSGHVCNFYSESSIREICADILAKKKNS